MIHLCDNVKIIENFLIKKRWANFTNIYCGNCRIWEKPDKFNNLWVAFISIKNQQFQIFYIERTTNPELTERHFKHQLKFYKAIIKTLRKVK